MPTAPGPIPPGAPNVAEVEGIRFLAGPDGRFLRRFRASGGWSEFRDRYAAAKAAQTPETPEWRLKVFLLPRNEILDVDEKGVARVRRSIMERPEIEFATQALAQFAVMAEAAAGGALRMRIELEVDADPAYQTARKGEPPFGAAFLQEYLRPRINGGLFEAEDRIYRGPWDGVFVAHGALSGPMPPVLVHDTAVSPIAIYAQGRSLGTEALALAFYNEWARHLAMAAARAGYAAARDWSGPHGPTLPSERAQGFGPRVAHPDVVWQGTMWSSIRGREDPATGPLAARQTRPQPPQSWEEASGDPFGRIPVLTEAEVLAKLGVDGPLVQLGPAVPGESVSLLFPGGSADPNANLDGRFEPNREAAAVAAYAEGTRQLTFVDAAYAELFARGIPAAASPAILGWLPAGNRLFLVFDSARFGAGEPEAKALALPGFSWQAPEPRAEPPAELIPTGQTASRLERQGWMTVEDASDPVRGDVLKVQTLGLVRWGAVTLLGAEGGPALPGKVFSVWLKRVNPEPMALRFYAPTGEFEEVRLFGSWPTPAERDSVGIRAISMPESDEWVQVAVPLSSLAMGSVARVELATGAHVGAWATKQPLPPVVLVDDARMTSDALGPAAEWFQPPSPEANSASKIPYERMLFAVQATAHSPELLALLKDPEDDVKLNAARAYARFRSAGAEPALIELLRSLDARVVEAAVQALANQHSDAAWAALKKAVESGPFDFTRVFSARELGAKPDPRMAATLSLMLTSRSWRGRMFAAESIAKVAAEPQQLILMAFLIETDPAVRLAATKGANTGVDDVCKRLLWSAVNDPSDEVRAWSCLKLIQSGNSKYVPEGNKGVRDESVGMRRRLLELLRENPSEAARPALRLAVADTDPTVRAAALRAFAALPGPVERAEVQNTLADPDPRVRQALEALRRAKGFQPALR
jgi:HEAT repeat protein